MDERRRKRTFRSRGERDDRSARSPGLRPAEAGQRDASVSLRDVRAEIVQGLRAGVAVVERRPADVLRILCTREVRREISSCERWARQMSVPCDEVSAIELDRLAESSHHEGLCVVATARRWEAARDLARTLARTRGAAVAFDRVRNPYNVGAILRSAAFFGFDGALFGAQAPHPDLASTAIRVAEGGVEHLLLARTTDLADTLARLRQGGVTVIGADGHADEDAIGFAYPRPTVLVVGHERDGLGARVRAQCDAVIGIRGSGAVESLNVAVAASVLMAEIRRDAHVRERAARSP